jgi:hypothetical protein
MDSQHRRRGYHVVPFASGMQMVRNAFAIILLVSSGFSQDSAMAARVAAGCGPNDVQFRVKADKNHHPTSQAEAGKALVYAFADEDEVNLSLHIGGITTKVGLDGEWVGANYQKSYFFFPVDPGDHRLCTSQQRTKIASAVSFTAEPHKIYYFRTRTPDHPRVEHPNEVILVPVDAAAAQLLVAPSAFSTSQRRK